MRYANIHKAIFQARPNRFIAQVTLDGQPVTVHVKNTGRCRELLVPGSTVYLVRSDNPARKTQYDLVAVEKGSLLINMDAQAPNQLFREWVERGRLLPDVTCLRPEYTYGDSRFDFYLERGGQPGLVEVKGCTLEEDGIARFPDAPTERGVKHIQGLIRAKEAGLEAWLCLVVQMEGMRCFMPNDATHPAFGAALRRAAEAGVHVQALECRVWPDGAEITGQIPVEL
ncbi:MAG: DNA/RNA nuclease SfsA [Clostridiales bacterium]|nr:DNA/RNA nuclease SfsA [Clostridiales bacterium]